MEKKVLLLVEDNPLLIGMYEAAFESAGYAVLLAHDGATGIAIARDKKPANVLLDLLMPGTNGFDVIEALKNSAETKDIGIVVLTSDTEPKDLKKARDLGASECLIKSELTLTEIVHRAIKFFK